MSLPERIYARLLVLYPPSFREHYGRHLQIAFRDALRDARLTGSSMAVAWTIVSAFGDLAVTAIDQRRLEGRRVPRPAAVKPVRSTSALPAQPLDRNRPAIAVAAMPLVAWFVAFMVAPGWVDPLFANPPAVLGLPAGAPMVAAALTLPMVGIALVTGPYRSVTRAIVSFACSVTSLCVLCLGPAAILYIQNLAV